MQLPAYFGIILAIIALVSWGFTDFFIQKSSRLVGVWKNLFTIGIIGSIFLFPFVKSSFSLLEKQDIIFLLVLGIVILFAHLFNFEALKKGKIAIVEPLLGLELPITIGLSIGIGKEHLSVVQFLFVAIIFAGLIMVITRHHQHLHSTRSRLEKGVMLGVAAAIGLALTNFLVGISSRQISPLMVIWFTHTQLAIISFIYLFYKKNFRGSAAEFKSTLGPSVLYNVGWVAFAMASTLAAISIVTAISESYIILGVLLGIFVNHEKIKRYQLVGIILACSGIIALSAFS